jgi:UDPglucose--hexose-1-phosphate uridylyltransferase
MPELRQNIATGEWVVIAPERGLKPRPLQEMEKRSSGGGIAYSKDCPFCPGNEDRYPNIETDRITAENGDWMVRAVENKFKILGDFEYCPVRPERFTEDGIYFKTLGCGFHDLVIEHAQHDKIIATMDPEHVEKIIEVYLNRYNAFDQNPNNLVTIIFKNHGIKAGASQSHAHSQIVSSRVVPAHTRFLLYEGQRYFDSRGACVYCDIVDFETKDRKRVVYENSTFVAIVPYAARTPFEVWIIPTKHNAGFGSISKAEKEGLARALHAVLRKMYEVLDNPDFNYVIFSSPYNLSEVPYYHWHLKIEPRLLTPGGFEVGTKINVNPTSPEESAEKLAQVRDLPLKNV